MSPELIISIISLALTTIVGVLTLIINVRITKLNNLEALHKYEKNITNFELQYKDELWLVDILQSGEFNNYNLKSKKRIGKWWEKYKKSHLVLLLTPNVTYKENELFRLNAGPDIFKKDEKTGTEVNQNGDNLPDIEDLF